MGGEKKKGEDCEQSQRKIVLCPLYVVNLTLDTLL